MLQTTRLQYTRQEGIIKTSAIEKGKVTIIGAGAVGSFAALAIAKMGVGQVMVYDEDGVNAVNLPNQFYRKEDVGQFKVDALMDILKRFSDSEVIVRNEFYTGKHSLAETVIVATDSMRSRKLVWESFLKQKDCINYIEARMGAELGMIYTVRKKFSLSKSLYTKKGKVKQNQTPEFMVPVEDRKFYEARLYPDSKVKPLPCTARAIIYNILMISSLIGRAYKAVVQGDLKFPKEIIFNMGTLDERSLMLTE